MNLGSRRPVVLDTGVFGARLTPSGRLLAALYRPTLDWLPKIEQGLGYDPESLLTWTFWLGRPD